MWRAERSFEMSEPSGFSKTRDQMIDVLRSADTLPTIEAAWHELNSWLDENPGEEDVNSPVWQISAVMARIEEGLLADQTAGMDSEEMNRQVEEEVARLFQPHAVE